MSRFVFVVAAALVAVLGCQTVSEVKDTTPDWKPIGARKVRVVLWGVSHNHAVGKLESLKLLKDDYEIVGYVSDADSKSMAFATLEEYLVVSSAARTSVSASSDPCAAKDLTLGTVGFRWTF